jgi:hypothetical protein
MVYTRVISSEIDRTQRGVVGLDSQKYTLDTSIYELKLVRLLRPSAFGPYGERHRYFVCTRPFGNPFRLAEECDRGASVQRVIRLLPDSVCPPRTRARAPRENGDLIRPTKTCSYGKHLRSCPNCHAARFPCGEQIGG